MIYNKEEDFSEEMSENIIEENTISIGKQIIETASEIVTLPDIEVNFAVKHFCSESYRGMCKMELMDEQVSRALSLNLNENFLRSFEAIQELVQSVPLGYKYRIVEGIVLIDGCDTPLQHCWIVDRKKNAVIDPILIKLGKTANQVNYFAAFEMAVDTFKDLEWQGDDNTPLHVLLDNECVEYSSTMINNLITATGCLIDNFNEQVGIEFDYDFFLCNINFHMRIRGLDEIFEQEGD
jgi:hypothetical protein